MGIQNQLATDTSVASYEAAYKALLIAPLTRLQTEEYFFLQIPKVLANADILVKCQIQLSQVIH